MSWIKKVKLKLKNTVSVGFKKFYKDRKELLK